VSAQEPDPTMEIDASILGWGAGLTNKGILVEHKSYLNYLEHEAFAKDRRNIHIHLRMNNRTV